jgi:hypothetical protein
MLDSEHQLAKIQEVLPESFSTRTHNHELKNYHRPGSKALLDLEMISALADESFCHCVGRFLPGKCLQVKQEVCIIILSILKVACRRIRKT